MPPEVWTRGRTARTSPPCMRVGEIKRLFTFPDEFELVGSRASIQAQLGNAVPPRLAEKVAAKIISLRQ